MYTVQCTWSGRGADLPFFAFRPWSKSAAKSGAPNPAYGICTRVINLTQTHLYVEHHTEKHLVPFLNCLIWLGLGWIRTLDLPNSLPLHYRVGTKYSYINIINNLMRICSYIRHIHYTYNLILIRSEIKKIRDYKQCDCF